MGKGRTPCCDKAGVKRGPWSEAEDLKLISFIHKHGHSNWRALPKLAGLSRCGKSCRLRWVNYLRPDLRRGNFTTEEEETIIKLHESLGNKWSKIASHFPGRTDNEIKNVWNTHLKKRLKGRTKSSNHSHSSNASSCTQPSHDHQEQHVTGKPSDLPSDQSSVNDENMLDADVLKDQTAHQPVQGGEIIIAKHVSAGSCRTLHSSNEHDESVPAAAAAAAAEPSSSSSTSFSSNNAEDFVMNINHDQQEQEVIEIPFEPNLDLWDLLDGAADYNSSSPTTFDAYHVDHTLKEEDVGTLLLTQPAADNDLQQVHQHQMNASTPHQVGSTCTPQGGEKLGQDQVNGSWRWWFGYLENELGLEETTHQNYQTAEGGHYQDYDQVKKMSAAPHQHQQSQPPPAVMMQEPTCSNNSSYSSSTTEQELLMLINQDNIHEPVESYFNASWEWPSSPTYLSTPII